MSKPEWNEDTPKWANWLAMDFNGVWWWHEKEPEEFSTFWMPFEGRSQRAGGPQYDWSQTKESRP